MRVLTTFLSAVIVVTISLVYPAPLLADDSDVLPRLDFSGSKSEHCIEQHALVIEETVTLIDENRQSRAACTGEWQGTGGGIITGWFVGDEYYAVYQDPIETGCTQTYPFAIETIHWDVYNRTDTTITLGPLRVVLYDVDRSESGCPKPGNAFSMSSQWSRDIAPNSTGLLSASYSTPVCVNGPYLVGIWCEEPFSLDILGLWADDPETIPPRPCASYNNWASNWQDLVVDQGWPWDLRLWSEGQNAESNNCGCDVSMEITDPESNSVSVPQDLSPSGSIGFLTFPHLDYDLLNSSNYKVWGNLRGYYSGTIAGKSFYPDQDFYPGELVTVTVTNKAHCDDGKYFQNGYSWQFTALSALSTNSFFPHADYATGGVNFSIVTADFNGDLYPDLATTNHEDSTVSVLINNGDGTFGEQTPYRVGPYKPRSIDAGDFNGDGAMDLVSVSYRNEAAPGLTGSITILIGEGNGSFSSLFTYIVGQGPNSIVAADLNNDGNLDVATTDAPFDYIIVQLGYGDGSFMPAYTVATGDAPVALVGGDFNDDGTIDLATANNRDDSISVFIGYGDGNFSGRSSYAAGDAPKGLYTSDFDGDGHLDLVSNSWNDRYVAVLMGNGDGTFKPKSVHDFGYWPYSIIAADLNGDGTPDLAMPDWTWYNNAIVAYGNGDGSFSLPDTFDVANACAAICAADFNGDGSLDLATANHDDSTVSILLNQTLTCCMNRGDVNHSGGSTPVDVSDLSYIVDYFFSGGPPPVCEEEGNIDGTGSPPIDISDLTYLVSYMFSGGPPPPACD